MNNSNNSSNSNDNNNYKTNDHKTIINDHIDDVRLMTIINDHKTSAFPAERTSAAILHTAVFRIKILHVRELESVRVLLSRGEITQNTGNSPGNLAQRILA